MERRIFGTADSEVAERRVDHFCQTHLGAGLAEILFRATGVGVALALRLEDERRVLLKAYQPDVSGRYLQEVHRTQAFLHDQGFPCPRPLLEPRPLQDGGHAHARVEELVEGGAVKDARDAGRRRSMAQLLADQVELTRGIRPQGLREGWTPFGGEGLWPSTSHHPIIRLRKVSSEAGWIDEIAAPLKPKASGGKLVVGHGDWTTKNLRFEGDRICMVYDWDSLKLDDEERIVASASITFTAGRGAQRVPSPEEAHAFVADYEAARYAPFNPAMRRRIAAARTFVLAYHARAEYARGLTNRRGSYTTALRDSWEQYVEP